MKIEQRKYSKNSGWNLIKSNLTENQPANLVLAFADSTILEEKNIFSELKSLYPQAEIILNSTAGEIYDTEVSTESISVTAMSFEKTKFKTTCVQMADMENSRMAGKSLALALHQGDLSYVMIISDGQKVNGSELLQGLKDVLPSHTIITGGLAGDGALFRKTLVGLNEKPIEGRIVAIGFYGQNMKIGYGSVGGWDSFGPERLITKSASNVLYELDGKPALDIYKMYLGEYAHELPVSGLLFPLSIRSNGSEEYLVRTILGVDEESKSLVFAGNMPEGAYARLMKANFDRLIEGASQAAHETLTSGSPNPELAILISCVGRKLVLNQRIEEEVEVIREVYGQQTALMGFYSYGEISPSGLSKSCELHNQTMTITTFSEHE